MKYPQLHDTKLKQVKFSDIKFRKLKKMELPIYSRITLIAGHNGIGKSTILGLIANASGITDYTYRSLFEWPFQSKFEEIFNLGESDYIPDASKKPNVHMLYELTKDSEKITFEKKCNVSRASSTTAKDGYRYRIVARTVRTSSEQADLIESLGIQQDAKVPIPTLYLGVTRLAPASEFIKDLVKTTENRSFDETTKKYFIDKYNEVMNSRLSNDIKMIDINIHKTRKKMKVPDMGHSPSAISVGQDSLMSILTALSSFDALKRANPDGYKGGILIVDEIDAGLHPHAQVKLIDLLKKECKDLNLQLIATTHSLFLLRNILLDAEKQKKSGNVLDGVIYIKDSNRPYSVKNVTYEEVEQDMFLINPVEQFKGYKSKIYFEDDEAKWFFEQNIEYCENFLNKNINNQYELTSIKLGCDTLMKLCDADEYFKSTVVVFDSDFDNNSKVSFLNKTPNAVVLPYKSTQNSNTPNKEKTVEYLIYDLLIHITEDDLSDQVEIFLQQVGLSTDFIIANLLDIDRDKIMKREPAKCWFNRHLNTFNHYKIGQLWCIINESEVIRFYDKLRDTIEIIPKLTRIN